MTTARTHTPDRKNADGSTTITTKRACNGCGQLLGDITPQEMQAAIHGAPLPDVRLECPSCAPTAPEPECRPMPVVHGAPACLELECDHHVGAGDYCDDVTETRICATHSRFEFPGDKGEIVHAEPWPCKQQPTA